MNIAFGGEMAPYLEPPRVLPVGTPGKTGRVRLGFELDGSGRSIMRDWERQAPLIVQQELYFDERMPDMPCVYILSSGGPNVDGDRYEQCFTVRRGACAHVSTGAATKIAEMRRNCSALVQQFDLEEDAYMEYLPEPTIPCRHARYVCDTTIRIAPSATLFYAEIYMSGRKYFGEGERFRYDILSVRTRAERPDGAPLYREKFIVRPGEHAPSVLGGDGRLRRVRQRRGAHAARAGRGAPCADAGFPRRAAGRGGGNHAPAERLRADIQGAGTRDGAGKGSRESLLLRGAQRGEGLPPARGVSVEVGVLRGPVRLRYVFDCLILHPFRGRMRQGAALPAGGTGNTL